MTSQGYNRADFAGRGAQLSQVVAAIRDPAAPLRCLIVEGAPRLGKTWFLHEVAEELRHPLRVTPPPGTPEARVCFFESADLAPAPGPFEQSQCAYGLLSKLWAQVADWLGAGHPPTPPPLDTQPLQTQLTRVVTALQERGAAGLGGQLVIVLDGLDEIDPRQLSAFDRQIAVVLFDSPLVRLLCSRRVKSTQHRFRELKIRRAETWLTLDPYDAAELQVDRLLAAAGSPARFPTLQRLLAHYAWANPGVNERLAAAYLRHGAIEAPALAAALDWLLEAALRGPAAALTRQRLGDTVRALAPAPGRPLSRFQLEQALGPLPLSERAGFLAELQERGVAVLDGPQVIIHSDIVELCRELDARGVRYGY